MKKAAKTALLLVCTIALCGAAYVAASGERSIAVVSAVKSSPRLIKMFLASSGDDGALLKGEDEGQVNIALLGIAGEEAYNAAPHLTDTILIAKLKTEGEKIKNAALISIPRDLYVKIPQSEMYTKMNALYSLGMRNDPDDSASLVRTKLEEISGLPIHYYIVFDLKAAESVIDRLDGISVYVPEDIYDPLFPAPHFGTETFTVSRGWQHMNGATAIKYARTRHTKDGDLGRMQRQQQVLDALRKKVFALNLFWNFPKIAAIYDDAKRNIATDLADSEIRRLWSMAKHIPFDAIYANTIGIENAKHLVREDRVRLGNAIGFVFVPSLGAEQYRDIREFIIRQ